MKLSRFHVKRNAVWRLGIQQVALRSVDAYETGNDWLRQESAKAKLNVETLREAPTSLT